jgi:hypothetical protein
MLESTDAVAVPFPSTADFDEPETISTPSSQPSLSPVASQVVLYSRVMRASPVITEPMVGKIIDCGFADSSCNVQESSAVICVAERGGGTDGLTFAQKAMTAQTSNCDALIIYNSINQNGNIHGTVEKVLSDLRIPVLDVSRTSGLELLTMADTVTIGVSKERQSKITFTLLPEAIQNEPDENDETESNFDQRRRNLRGYAAS